MDFSFDFWPLEVLKNLLVASVILWLCWKSMNLG